MLLKMVCEYCQCVDDIPSAIPDVLTRLVELLKVSLAQMLGSVLKTLLYWNGIWGISILGDKYFQFGPSVCVSVCSGYINFWTGQILDRC